MSRSQRFARLIVVIACALAPCVLMAQGSGSGLDLDRLSSATKAQGSLSSLLTAEQFPTDDVVDPTVYMLGPGDILAYQTTGIDFMEKMTVVSPENTIMLERIGVVNVAGKTLQQLRDTLSSIMKLRSASVDIFVTLRRARLVYVTLKGNVTYPGTYAVPASMRVSTFLTVMRQPWLLSKDGGLSEMAKGTGLNVIPTKAQELTRSTITTLGPFASRNIAVRHRRGSQIADIPLSRVNGNSHLDPHVRESDEIEVPYEDHTFATVSISGAVVSPTTLAYKQGDRVSLLLAAAGGPTSDADLSRVYVIHSTGGGKQRLTVTPSFDVDGQDVELQPGSTVIVERRVETGAPASQGVVQVYGEVASPGAVVIKPGITRLSEVISVSGGVLPQASLALSYIVRPERGAITPLQQRDDAYRTFQYSDLKLEDTTRYHIDQKYRLPYVSCDMAVALRDSASADNIVMQTGDIVVVQPTPDRVFVYGQVSRPGYVPFTPNKRLEWYVERAGGYAAGARDDRARIIKGKSKVWVEDDEKVFVEPGDEVYVPRPPDIPVGTELQTYAIIASIVSSVVALTATLIAVLR